MDFREAFESLRATEAQLLASYEEDVGADLRLVDEACALLMLVLLNGGPRTGTLEKEADSGELSGDVRTLERAFRVIRAARAILAFGYEREAPALDRILVELQAHRTVIHGDQSGKEALAWLRRERTHGIAKRVREIALAISTATCPATPMATRCLSTGFSMRAGSWSWHHGAGTRRARHCSSSIPASLVTRRS